MHTAISDFTEVLGSVALNKSSLLWCIREKKRWKTRKSIEGIGEEMADNSVWRFINLKCTFSSNTGD